MDRNSSLGGWCVLAIFGVVLLTYSSAERQYFPQNTNATWVDARSHCQVCFKELVTVTSENAQTVVQDLSLDYWIGLRKRPVNASMNSTDSSFNNTTMFWSRWANGDPLTFQNWYLGHPVFKSPFPRRDCCSCSCTCPAPPTTPPVTTAAYTNSTWSNDVTTFTQSPNITQSANHSAGNTTAAYTNSTWSNDVTTFTQSPNITQSANHSAGNTTASVYSTTNRWTSPFTTTSPLTNLPLQSQCERSPMLFPDVPDPDASYIEDPCVAMLSFGAWVERECWERLPFICYEDRFYGQVNVSNITSSSASLTWVRGPGNITHYRLEVTGPQNITNVTQTELTYSLSNLTAGTKYSVQVFPVKCGRDLNPENATFYTVPSQVSNLHVVNQTESCVWLNWTEPSSHVDLYIIKVEALTKDFNGTGGQMCGLASGSLHNFTVRSAVKDKSQISDESTIFAYTRPEKVSNLSTLDVNDTSLRLDWDAPTGTITGYWVTYFWQNGTYNASGQFLENNTEHNMTNLPSATMITLNVTALVNNSLRGDTVTVFSCTNPRPITNLTLNKATGTITATWTNSEGSPRFKVELNLTVSDTMTVFNNVTEKMIMFTGLKNAAKYTVSVYSVIGNATSKAVSQSIFTPPLPPTAAILAAKNKTHLTFTWMPPANTVEATYLLTLNSSFWGQYWQYNLYNKTTHTFGSLTPGTNYTFTVQTIAGDINELSVSEYVTGSTDPDKTEIILSMMCSSTQSLNCDSSSTRQSVFNQLQAKFNSLLGDHVFWELKNGGANTGT